MSFIISSPKTLPCTLLVPWFFVENPIVVFTLIIEGLFFSSLAFVNAFLIPVKSLSPFLTVCTCHPYPSNILVMSSLFYQRNLPENAKSVDPSIVI
jgi:hypothetical protein